MIRRRTFLAGALVAASGLAGCAATREEFEFEATPGKFAADAVARAGYEELERREFVVERDVEAAGSTRHVTVTNYATPYRRTVSMGGRELALAGALVFTTPSTSFFGREFNPVADWSLRKIVENAKGRVNDNLEGGGLREITKAGERTMTVLGTETTVGVFDGVTDAGGATVDVRTLVTRVEHDGDFVIVAAVYPKRLAADERPRAEILFGNVEH